MDVVVCEYRGGNRGEEGRFKVSTGRGVGGIRRTGGLRVQGPASERERDRGGEAGGDGGSTGSLTDGL